MYWLIMSRDMKNVYAILVRNHGGKKNPGEIEV
jgi:hypothetical protein